MTQMEKEYFGAAVFQDCELSSLMLHFFAIIGRKLHQNAPHENISSLRQKEQQERFSMLCNYINAHCTEDLSLDELANEAGFSKYHFARLFTQARACDHCVILRRIKFNRRIRIKSRRMVSVMKVKFDRHKGRVFFTGGVLSRTCREQHPYLVPLRKPFSGSFRRRWYAEKSCRCLLLCHVPPKNTC